MPDPLPSIIAGSHLITAAVRFYRANSAVRLFELESSFPRSNSKKGYVVFKLRERKNDYLRKGLI